MRSASGPRPAVLIATAAALAYGGGFGWISMVLVAPDWPVIAVSRRC